MVTRRGWGMTLNGIGWPRPCARRVWTGQIWGQNGISVCHTGVDKFCGFWALVKRPCNGDQERTAGFGHVPGSRSLHLTNSYSSFRDTSDVISSRKPSLDPPPPHVALESPPLCLPSSEWKHLLAAYFSTTFPVPSTLTPSLLDRDIVYFIDMALEPFKYLM